MGKNQNNPCTNAEILEVLHTIHICAKHRHFTISMNHNRMENVAFLHEYGLKSECLIQILSSLTVEDFCYKCKNAKKGFEQEDLYVFVPKVQLMHEGRKECVEIYIKCNFIQVKRRMHLIVISFHKKRKQVQYAFQKKGDAYETTI
ncbi:MAG: hypothetical protein HFF01_08090 [Erysipelotrichaceae bacterium]|nr:hypothetical protein [Erysipelotrichaceae bacterium]MCI9524983.1 hypothetical protein [Erysipelotrichaceae bacterium]